MATLQRRTTIGGTTLMHREFTQVRGELVRIHQMLHTITLYALQEALEVEPRDHHDCSLQGIVNHREHTLWRSDLHLTTDVYGA